MIIVERFINDLMSSNCYVVWEDETNHCFIVDPASEKAEKEISYIEGQKLILDYIFLTHEHTDHTWGVNALVDKFHQAKVICSKICRQELSEASCAYFRLYYDDSSYTYSVNKIDLVTEEINNVLQWNNHLIQFLSTPGHSAGSICINVDDILFTGDTIMQYKPYINKKNGSVETYRKSLNIIESLLLPSTIIYPGHGDQFLLSEYINPYKSL